MAEPVTPETTPNPEPVTPAADAPRPPRTTQAAVKAAKDRKKKKKVKKDEPPPAPPQAPDPVEQGAAAPPPGPPEGGGDPQVGGGDDPEQEFEESLTKIGEEMLRKQLGLERGKRPPPIASQALAVAAEVIPRFVQGKPTAQIKEKVAKVASAVDEKYKVLGSIVDSHMQERYLLHANMRWDLEQSLYRDLQADSLPALAKVAIYKMVREEAALMEKIIRAGANPLQDVQNALEKVDTVQKQTPGAMAKRLEGTTPQGREVARRLAAQAAALSKKLSSTIDRTGG